MEGSKLGILGQAQRSSPVAGRERQHKEPGVHLAPLRKCSVDRRHTEGQHGAFGALMPVRPSLQPAAQFGNRYVRAGRAILNVSG